LSVLHPATTESNSEDFSRNRCGIPMLGGIPFDCNSSILRDSEVGQPTIMTPMRCIRCILRQKETKLRLFTSKTFKKRV